MTEAQRIIDSLSDKQRATLTRYAQRKAAGLPVPAQDMRDSVQAVKVTARALGMHVDVGHMLNAIAEEMGREDGR